MSNMLVQQGQIVPCHKLSRTATAGVQLPATTCTAHCQHGMPNVVFISDGAAIDTRASMH